MSKEEEKDMLKMFKKTLLILSIIMLISTIALPLFKGVKATSENSPLDIGDFEEDDEGNEENMNESTDRLFELVLEYNSNVGYTDNYQKKDVMTNQGMSEPGKNVNDWDAGVPHDAKKPWSGKKDKANAKRCGESCIQYIW